MARAPSFEYPAIVVGVDFSTPSRVALARAADLAHKLGSQLVIVHVVRKLQAALPFSRRNRATVAELQRMEMDEAQARLRKLVPRLPGLVVKTRVVAGTPSEALLAQARRSRAGLLVLSNLGHSSFEEILIGSTAERCLRQAEIPVLLVPAPRRSARRRGRR